MRKCALCGQDIFDKKKCVTVVIGRWFRRKKKHFHIDCFIANKHRASKIAVDATKS